MSIFEDQKEFMLAGGQSVGEMNSDQIELYEELIDEEISELALELFYYDYVDPDQQAKVIKEAIDVIVVTSGLLLSMGVDAEKAWDIVHENNMLKTQNVEYDKNGKIKKSKKSKQAKKAMMNKIMELIDD